MCLILFAHAVHPAHRLVVAANRDEFHGRAATPAAFWSDRPQILAGRDLEAGGTWLGVTRRGRFAAVTNFSEAPPEPMPPRSRGALVTDFLAGDEAPGDYLDDVARLAAEFRGFNLLVGDERELWYYSNRIDAPQRLEPGIYGLSNHLLDTDWPKVRRGKSALQAFRDAEAGPEDTEVEALLALLADDTQPTARELEAAGLDPTAAARVAPCFIRGDLYGTRASTAVLMREDGEVLFTEQRFGPDGHATGRDDYRFTVEQPAGWAARAGGR